MIKLYICCLVLIVGSVEVGPDMDVKFHQEVMEIVSYDNLYSRKCMMKLLAGQFVEQIYRAVRPNDFNQSLPDRLALF